MASRTQQPPPAPDAKPSLAAIMKAKRKQNSFRLDGVFTYRDIFFPPAFAFFIR
jgi:hypothetical protein